MEAEVPYGWWPSPLSAAGVASARRSRSLLHSDGERLYWVEARPDQGGRQVLLRAAAGGQPEELTGPQASVRSGVHQYGGGAYCLLGGGGGSAGTSVAYVDQEDQRIVVLAAGEPAGPATRCSPVPPGGEAWSHGDLRGTPDGRWILAVRERTAPGARTVTREIVAYDVARPGPGTVMAGGRDFVAAPRVDRSGRWLAWVTWDHPDMSWDASELWVGTLEGTGGDGAVALSGAHRVAGGRGPRRPGSGESVGQPTWCGDGSLVFMSDAGGWWQPWRWTPGRPAQRVTDDPAEYHGPDWQLGQATVVELSGGVVACRRRRAGIDQVGLVDPDGGRFSPVEQDAVTVVGLCAHAGGVAWLGSTPDQAGAVWWFEDPGTADRAARPRVHRVVDPAVAAAAGTAPPAGPAGSARPAGPAGSGSFSFHAPTSRTVHGLWFPPALAGVRGPPGERCPLIVHCHGGPTGSAEAGFDPVLRFFTTRGFAVAAVDYAGSTGYGRDYRRNLWGAWGLADPQDCADAAAHLVDLGLVDGSRMAVRGSSAGGFTALCALAGRREFTAAVSWYGVTDLEGLAASTHDFEAHYTDRLVGPLPGAAAEYRRRSPVARAAQMAGSVLLLQGSEDPVVPPEQARAMAGALERHGVPVTVRRFPGEGHGFRRAESVAAALEAELAFYRAVWWPDGPGP